MTTDTAVLPRRATPVKPLGCTAVQPVHGGYDAARSAWNLAADLRPAAVVTATTVGEVQAAVRLAAAHGLRVAPITTGHLAAALPQLDDAILLRTELGREVAVDPVTRQARISAGALWEDVVEAAAAHGLAVAHGSSPDVGVVGYLLAGGLSFYGRHHGLAANHIVTLEVVCADGELRRASAIENPDLFWALRGGAANFGVVTAVVLSLLPYAEVFAGAAFWPIADAAALLPVWTEWTRDAPTTVTTSARLLRLPPVPAVPEPLRGVPVFAVDGIAIDHADGEALMARLRAVAEPMIDLWGPMPSAAALRIHGDPEQPTPGMGEHELLTELDQQAIDALLAVAGDGADTPLLMAELRQLGGALSTSPGHAGARGRLEGRFALLAIGCPMAPELAAPIRAALDGLKAAMAPWATGRRLLSFAEDGGDAHAGFDEATYARLAQLRTEWDPTGRMVSSHEVAGR